MSTERVGPELVVALIGAIGTPLDRIAQLLERALARVSYECVQIRLSELLQSFGSIPNAPEDTRIEAAMSAGTELREKLGRGDAVAALAVAEIARRREANTRGRCCYVLRSLKHPAEVDALRAVYAEQFIAVAVHAPKEERVSSLAQRIADTRQGRADEYRSIAEQLIARDEAEHQRKLGQRVQATFPKADIFLTTTRELERQVERFIDLLFAKPVVTPERDEVGMFHAIGAAMRSAAMGRQVGASLVDANGELISSGCNEVARAGGGQYWAGDIPDGRDFQFGFDQSDIGKRRVFRELITRLHALRLISDDDPATLAERLLSDPKYTSITEAAVLNLTEFTRDVHAEAAAIVTAARVGRSTRGASLYATTFPCHNCAKHIIAAGVTRVVYIEPYPKSYAHEFYRDAIELDAEHPAKVAFVPFVGVAPRRFLEWFRMQPRKTDDGVLAPWRPDTAMPAGPAKLGLDPGYLARELALVRQVGEALRAAGSVTKTERKASLKRRGRS